MVLDTAPGRPRAQDVRAFNIICCVGFLYVELYMRARAPHPHGDRIRACPSSLIVRHVTGFFDVS
jgi:hypothetical protein